METSTTTENRTAPAIGAKLEDTATLYERADRAIEQCDMLTKHLDQLSNAAALMKQFIKESHKENEFYKFLSKRERVSEAERERVILAMCYWYK